MPTYSAHFQYEFADDAYTEIEERSGRGLCQLDIEREPKTAEEWVEVSRTIGEAAGGAYKSVEIVKLIELPENVTPDSGEVLEGTVVE